MGGSDTTVTVFDVNMMALLQAHRITHLNSLRRVRRNKVVRGMLDAIVTIQGVENSAARESARSAQLPGRRNCVQRKEQQPFLPCPVNRPRAWARHSLSMCYNLYGLLQHLLTYCQHH
jgi:hypothetical protein